MARRPVDPLEPGWVLVSGRPVFHRSHVAADAQAPVLVHVHGFGISGTYLEPTAARLAQRHPTYVPDLPGMGRSVPPDRALDLPELAEALIGYCDAVGVQRAVFVGNSLGCPLIIEVAHSFPDRIDGAVLVSPAGGPNNQPLHRALRQMVLDAPREPLSMLPIAVRDYLRFGVVQGWRLFGAMMRYDSLHRLRDLRVPTLVIAGERDPLVQVERAQVFAGLPHVDVVVIPGAHALNFSSPELVAALIRAHLDGRPLDGVSDDVQVLELDPAAAVP